MSPPHHPYSYKNSVKSDVSDELINVYLQRPIAGLITRALYRTTVTPNQLTIVATLFGMAGGILLGGRTAHCTAAAFCFYAKDLFDSADGQLARAKRLYSRRGRFLDSIGDYVVDLFLFGGISLFLFRSGESLPFSISVSLAGFLGISLRVSYHVFYQTSYLHKEKQYGANRRNEELREEDFREDVATVRLQKTFYLLYGWQDRIMDRLDVWCMGGGRRGGAAFEERWYRDRTGLLLGGFLGFGTEFVLLTICLLFGSVRGYLFCSLIALNCVWLSAISYRKVVLWGKIPEEEKHE